MSLKNKRLTLIVLLSIFIMITAFLLGSCRFSDKVIVCFNPMGGTPAIECQIIPPGGRLEPIPAPERRGFTFAGWYRDPPYFAKSWDFNNCFVWNDKTLYARWIPVRGGGGGGGGGGGSGGGGVIVTPKVIHLVWDNDTWHEAFDTIDTSPIANHIIYLSCCSYGECGIPNEINIFFPDGRNREVTGGRIVDIRRLNDVDNSLAGGTTAPTHSRITVGGSGSRLILRGPTLNLVRIFVEAGGMFELIDGIIRGNPNFGNAFPWSAVNVTGPGSRFDMLGGTIGGAPGLGNTSAQGGGVRVAGGSTFNMIDGTISFNSTGANLQHGGGVHLTDNAQGKMTGGIIEHNFTLGNGQGGGVFVNNGSTFTMSGGYIRYNHTVSGAGAGVSITGTGTAFIMNAGATIHGNNSVFGNGGGVNLTGTGTTFIMNAGAVISYNHVGGAGNGGGVRLQSGGGNADSVTFTMNGGIIKRNKTTGNGSGGGVIIDGQSNGPSTTAIFNINDGGEIYDNDSNGQGGGVQVTSCGRLNMSAGALIHNNRAAGQGGGVDVRGNNANNRSVFAMSGGTIKNNEAVVRGGGVNIYGGGGYPLGHNTFYMSGGIIQGNRTQGYGGGVVVVSSGNRFYMSEGATIMGYPSNQSFFGISPPPPVTNHAIRRSLGRVILFDTIHAAGFPLTAQNWNQTIDFLNIGP